MRKRMAFVIICMISAGLGFTYEQSGKIQTEQYYMNQHLNLLQSSNIQDEISSRSAFYKSLTHATNITQTGGISGTLNNLNERDLTTAYVEVVIVDSLPTDNGKYKEIVRVIKMVLTESMDCAMARTG